MRFIDKIRPPSSIADVEQALQQIEAHFNIHLTVHDSLGILRDADGKYILPGRNVHQNAYCLTGRHKRPSWNAHCTAECYRGCEAYMERERTPFIKSCWKGVWELVVPIIRDETLMLSLFAGVFREPGTTAPDSDEALPAQFGELYAELPEYSEEIAEELTGVLQFLGMGILSHAIQVNNVPERPSTRKEMILSFIYGNAHRSIKLGDLAQQLHLSESRTSHLTKQYFNRTFQELLTKERMERARVLLLSTDNSLEEICSALGLGNVYYFNRLFKNYYGLPPGRYRREKASG